MNASAPFKAKAPFKARVIGVNHQAFGLDFINPAFATNYGCLNVTPSIEWDTSGFPGGPFSVESVVYTLSNTGGATMNWSVATTAVWLDISVASGSLDSLDSTTVTVSMNALANTLAAGSYPATITFTNETNNCGDTTIGVNLSVSTNLALTVQYRTKGGTASLCGFSEFASPSSPPKKYRVNTFSGQATHLTWFSTSVCSGAPNCTLYETYAGVNSYDANCNYTQGATDTQSGNCTSGSVTSIATIVPYTPMGETMSNTQTTSALTSPETCVPGFDPTNRDKSVSPTGLMTLSVEDTESDAITRLMASSSYTAYTIASVIGDALSSYESRTTLFTFLYRIAEYKLTQTGLTPFHLYNGSCNIYRRAQGSSDPWSLVSTTVVSGTTDGAGNFLFGPVALPISLGWEYTVWDAGVSP